MSTQRRLYSKAEIKLLAGAPGALARPPKLLAAVDRSNYEKRISPDRAILSVKNHQKSQKQRAGTHASSQVSPFQQKWKPKQHDQRLNGYKVRHWENSQVYADNEEAEPEWADEVVNYSENFDFSQATLERDKHQPDNDPAAASLPRRSRFGFALEDALDLANQASIRHPVSTAFNQTQALDSQQHDRARQSRFKFTETTSSSADDIVPAFQQHSVSPTNFVSNPKEIDRESLEELHDNYSHAQQEQLLNSRPSHTRTQGSQSFRNPTTPSVRSHDVLPSQFRHSQSSVPIGKPIEVSEMFQIYAMASSLPATSSLESTAPSPSAFGDIYGAESQILSQSSPHYVAPLASPAYHHMNAPVNLSHPPGFRSGISGTPATSVPIRPLHIAGLGQPQPQHTHVLQPSSSRSKSSSSENARSKDDTSQAPNRPKAPVPAPAAPPSYVRSYMNLQISLQPVNAGRYMPPGMTTSFAQGYTGHHIPFRPPSPPAPFR